MYSNKYIYLAESLFFWKLLKKPVVILMSPFSETTCPEVSSLSPQGLGVRLDVGLALVSLSHAFSSHIYFPSLQAQWV